MKLFNTIALVLIPLFIGICLYFIVEVASVRYRLFYSMNFDVDFNTVRRQVADLTILAALVMLIFSLYFAAGYIANMVKVKTVTTKVLCIIGLCFTFIMLLWNILLFVDPNAVSFDEAGAGWLIYGLINLAFYIVLLIQAGRFAKKDNPRSNYDDVVLDNEVI